MPRRNKPKRSLEHVPDWWKPKGKKRPRGWHHKSDRDAHLAEAQERFADAEARLA